MTYADYKSATSPDPTLGSSHAPPAAQHPFRTPTNASQAPSQSPEEAGCREQHADALARELADPAQGHDVYVIAEQGLRSYDDDWPDRQTLRMGGPSRQLGN